MTDETDNDGQMATSVPDAAEAAPAAAQLKVSTKKLSAKKRDEDDAPPVRHDGETRTETDPGPVQMAAITNEPREIEELEFPALKITRVRF